MWCHICTALRCESKRKKNRLAHLLKITSYKNTWRWAKVGVNQVLFKQFGVEYLLSVQTKQECGMFSKNESRGGQWVGTVKSSKLFQL